MWLLGVFVSGLLFGAVLASLIRPDAIPQAQDLEPPPWRDQQRQSESMKPREGGLLKRLSQELTLRPDQEEQVRKVLESSRERYRKETRRSRREFETIRKNTTEEIRRLLDPEQSIRLDEWIERHEERHQKRNHPSDRGSRP